jgi:hypothetical protein
VLKTPSSLAPQAMKAYTPPELVPRYEGFSL